MDDVISLIKTQTVRDKYGIQTTQETSTDVFCEVKSASRAEWFDGARVNLNPQFVFIIKRAEYEDETIVSYNQKKYSIYRTYIRDPDHIELHCEFRKGTS